MEKMESNATRILEEGEITEPISHVSISVAISNKEAISNENIQKTLDYSVAPKILVGAGPSNEESIPMVALVPILEEVSSTRPSEDKVFVEDIKTDVDDSSSGPDTFSSCSDEDLAAREEPIDGIGIWTIQKGKKQKKKEKNKEPTTPGSKGVTTRSKEDGGIKLKADVGSHKKTQGRYTNKEIRERESKKDIVDGKKLTIRGACTLIKK